MNVSDASSQTQFQTSETLTKARFRRQYTISAFNEPSCEAALALDGVVSCFPTSWALEDRPCALIEEGGGADTSVSMSQYRVEAPRVGVLAFTRPRSCGRYKLEPEELLLAVADGHTASNAPDLFRPPKLSGAGPGQYWGGGPPGNTLGCCRLFVC